MRNGTDRVCNNVPGAFVARLCFHLQSVRAAATCGSNWLRLEGIPEVSAKLEMAC